MGVRRKVAQEMRSCTDLVCPEVRKECTWKNGGRSREEMQRLMQVSRHLAADVLQAQAKLLARNRGGVLAVWMGGQLLVAV